MLVENGGHGIEAIAEFGEAFLEFDGFGFLHGSNGIRHPSFSMRRSLESPTSPGEANGIVVDWR
jgi:hypothetical protein